MKKFLYFLFILFCGCLFSCPSYSQTFVQVATNATTPCSGTGSGTCVFGSNNTAGNTIILFVACRNVSSSCAITFTDSRNTYAKKATCDDFTNLLSELQVWEADNIGAGANTITEASFSGNWTVFAAEYSGLTTSTSFDQSACGAASTGSGTAATFGTTSTTGQANELVTGWGMATQNWNASNPQGTGFTKRGFSNSASNKPLYEDKNVTSTGVQSATAVASTTFINYLGVTATFKAAGGGAACSPTLTLIGVGRCG